jgi:hypothetical protein
VRDRRPLPVGVTFTFVVDFENLRDAELDLLLYCLVLEEDVTVTLSPAALLPGAVKAVTLRGPLRHKIGGCKPHGAGSVHLRMEVRVNPADRYRGSRGVTTILEGEPLVTALRQRTRQFAGQQDDTMGHLRAMLIYDVSDPRAGKLEYPDFPFFQREKEDQARTPLKPVL